MAQAPRSFPVGRSDRSRARSSGNPGPPLVQAIRQADRVAGASQYANGAWWSITHPVDRLTGKGRAANPTMEVPWVAGRPWFHGSSRAFEKFDPAQADPRSMYGPGHYVTDDPAIASSYTTKGRAPYSDDVWDYEYLDAFTRDIPKARRRARSNVVQYAKNQRDRGRKVGDEVKITRLRGQMPNSTLPAHGFRVEGVPAQYGPNVTRYAFEPDEVFDVAAPVSPRATSSLLEALANEPQVDRARAAAAEVRELGGTIPNAMNALWHALENHLGATRANEVIRAAGYDAIRYPGGAMTGGKAHNALVVLNDALLHRGGIPNPKHAGVPRPTHGGR